jgi:hypothetical protein
MTDTVEKVDFSKCAKFSRGAGAFVRKLYGGTHEQSHFQPAGLVNSLQGIRVPTAVFNGSAARFYRHPPFLVFQQYRRVGPGNFAPSPSQNRTGTSRFIRLVPPHEGCRLPLFIGFLPLPVDPIQMAMACFLRSAGITPASSLLQSSPPLTGASVLSASRLAPLAPFPLASPCRFSRSIQEPGRASRRLYAGCRSGRLRHPPS